MDETIIIVVGTRRAITLGKDPEGNTALLRKIFAGIPVMLGVTTIAYCDVHSPNGKITEFLQTNAQIVVIGQMVDEPPPPAPKVNFTITLHNRYWNQPVLCLDTLRDQILAPSRPVPFWLQHERRPMNFSAAHQHCNLHDCHLRRRTRLNAGPRQPRSMQRQISK